MLVVLGVLLLTAIHLLGCAHGLGPTGGDTISAFSSPSASCLPPGTGAEQHGIPDPHHPGDGHHALCGPVLDRPAGQPLRSAYADAPASSAGATVSETPAVPARGPWAARLCALPRPVPGTLVLLCVSRT
jgi:hypothetical protein